MPAYDETRWVGYLEGLGMGRFLIDQVRGHIGEYRIAFGSSPEYIFVENPVDPLGKVEFTNLVLLSGTTYIEFALNQPSNSITIFNFSKEINRIVMPVMQQVAFGEITEGSRLTVQLLNNLEIIAFFMAAGANCEDLMEMVRRYFIPAIAG
jgi:hypothetical protein